MEKQYSRALKDIIDKTTIIQRDIDLLKAAGESDDKTLSMIRSKVYQKEYQEALKKQIEAILDKLHSDEFSTIQGYLNSCYEDGFIGTMYDIAGQGVSIVSPIDQNAVVKAVQLDSKVGSGKTKGRLYTELGIDIDKLKKTISSEVSRGIATSLSYSDIARNINNASGAPMNRAKTIARTEGHRIQQQSAEDARQAAKEKGADVVKQWDSTLDGRTRDSHRRVDGEIRENNEKFSNGLRYPGDPSGAAAEVVNCRCVALTRARWGLDDDELQTLKDRAEYFGLDKTENFEDYKKKYLKATENLTNTVNDDRIISGGISGGRNPFGDKAQEHAERYYEAVRKMKNDVNTIARNLGLPKEEIEAVKKFIFIDEHDLGNGMMERFFPDYMMAESWQRLIEGKQEPHDETLIKHEILERKLMRNGLSQEEAHIEASKQFNYSKEAREYYAKIKKYKDG